MSGQSQSVQSLSAQTNEPSITDCLIKRCRSRSATAIHSVPAIRTGSEYESDARCGCGRVVSFDTNGAAYDTTIAISEAMGIPPVPISRPEEGFSASVIAAMRSTGGFGSSSDTGNKIADSFHSSFMFCIPLCYDEEGVRVSGEMSRPENQFYVLDRIDIQHDENERGDTGTPKGSRHISQCVYFFAAVAAAVGGLRIATSSAVTYACMR